jgi:hypothetical protein
MPPMVVLNTLAAAEASLSATPGLDATASIVMSWVPTTGDALRDGGELKCSWL